MCLDDVSRAPQNDDRQRRSLLGSQHCLSGGRGRQGDRGGAGPGMMPRGAVTAALEATLRYLTERGGRQVADVCSSTNWIRFLRVDGSVRHEQQHRYLFSSWNTIYRSLLGLFDPDRYLLGREVTGFSRAADSVRVTLAGGQEAKADLLVCADGVSSPAR